jgi:MFS family permease
VVIERVTFGDALRVREFRTLWLADAQSLAGDQLARLALSVLVFERTSSSALTALTYALTFLPALVGGAFLAGLADRLPRRELMISCDVARAVLLASMALPGMPLVAICILLVLSVLLGSPFSAAENALVPGILEGERYVVATGLRTITGQLAQLAGFAGGGLVIAVISERGALAVDAGTFALSAALLAKGLKRRPAARSGDPAGPAAYFATILAGAKLVASDRRLRILLGLGWLAGLFVVPEGVAAPYAEALGGGARATGLLMASMPAGTAVGTYIFMRFVPNEVRRRCIGALAVGTAIPLALCVVRPGVPGSLILWCLSGLFGAYLAQVFAEYARAVPDGQRGQAIGIASSGSLAVQGIGVLLGGVVAWMWSSVTAVWVAGTVEAVCAVVLALGWSRVLARERQEIQEEMSLTRGEAENPA